MQFLSFLFTAVLVSAGDLRPGVVSGIVSSPAKAGSIVYVDAIPGQEFPASAKPFVMDQKSMLFKPHVLAVPVGSTVQFLNHDSMRHNVFWPNINGDHKLSHNPGSLRAGGIDTLRFKFDAPGVVPLRCNVHPDMSVYIIVSPTLITQLRTRWETSGLPVCPMEATLSRHGKA